MFEISSLTLILVLVNVPYSELENITQVWMIFLKPTQNRYFY